MDMRYDVIMNMLSEEGIAPEDIDVFVGRGGSALGVNDRIGGRLQRI